MITPADIVGAFRFLDVFHHFRSHSPQKRTLCNQQCQIYIYSAIATPAITLHTLIIRYSAQAHTRTPLILIQIE